MSSSSVCQGLQSCLEPRVIEPRVLRLKLAPPGSNFPPPYTTTTADTSTKSSSSSTTLDQEKPLTKHECDDKKETKTEENMEGSGWSFLQALATPNSNCNKTEDDKIYVHPTVKRSSSVLSEKSLEMCTESLGSETGSNAGESSDDISLFSLESNNSSGFSRHDSGTSDTNWVSRRVNKASSYPPPLTSITDFGGVHVRPHREGGRLILEAVASPSPRTYFRAEREGGRLKLLLFEEGVSDNDDDEVEEEEEGVVEEWSDCDDVVVDDDDEVGEEEGESEREEKKEEEENVEDDEKGVKKLGRPSRCKESGNRDIFGDGYFELPTLSLCL